jgi:hypothetical protein
MIITRTIFCEICLLVNLPFFLVDFQIEKPTEAPRFTQKNLDWSASEMTQITVRISSIRLFPSFLVTIVFYHSSWLANRATPVNCSQRIHTGLSTTVLY